VPLAAALCVTPPRWGRISTLISGAPPARPPWRLPAGQFPVQRDNGISARIVGSRCAAAEAPVRSGHERSDPRCPRTYNRLLWLFCLPGVALAGWFLLADHGGGLPGTRRALRERSDSRRNRSAGPLRPTNRQARRVWSRAVGSSDTPTRRSVRRTHLTPAHWGSSTYMGHPKRTWIAASVQVRPLTRVNPPTGASWRGPSFRASGSRTGGRPSP
jgi:hypothetical protein